MRIQKSKLSALVCLCLTVLFTACGLDKYNAVTEKTKDVRDKSELVYGDGKGKPARQAAQTYADPADAQQRADAIKEKFFGKGDNAETTTAAPADSVKTDTAKPAEKKAEPAKAK
jgi:hypothetical protein